MAVYPCTAPRLFKNCIFQRPVLHHLLPVLLLLLLSPGSHADYPIEIIPLKHQTVDQILPMLQPFVAEDGAVTGMNGQLVIKTSRQNLEQLRRIIDKFDRAPRQLRITVREGHSAAYNRHSVDLQGRAPLGEKGHITLGQPDRDDGLEVRIGAENRTLGTDADRHLRATEGMPAFIQTGISAPVITGYRDGWGRFYQEQHYQDITSGFYVTPWVNGDQVTLDISPFSSQPLDQGGSYRKQEINTRIRGHLGEWIEIGGASMQGQGGRQAISGLKRASAASGSPVSVKVDLVP